MMDAVRAAKSKMPYEHEGGGLTHVEQYAADLKSIDLAGVPYDVQDALRNYIKAVENNAEVRRNRGNTNAADVAWKEAEDALGRAAGHYSLPPS